MRMRLFHDQSVFMGEMAVFVLFCFFFFFFSRKLLIHYSVQLLFLSGSVHSAIFFVQLSHQHTFIAFPVSLKSEHPGRILVLSFLQGLAGIHRLNFVFSCSTSGHRGREEYRRSSRGGGRGSDAWLSATFENISRLHSQ